MVWSPFSLAPQIFNVANPKYIIGIYSGSDTTSIRCEQLLFCYASLLLIIITCLSLSNETSLSKRSAIFINAFQ